MISTLARQCFCLVLVTAGCLAGIVTEQPTSVFVTNTNDSGAGSLRQAIASTPAGGSIEFNIPTTDSGYDSLNGRFYIVLNGGELQIGRDLTITGPTSVKVEITGNTAARNFNILAGNVSISNLTISRGYALGATGADQTPTTNVPAPRQVRRIAFDVLDLADLADGLFRFSVERIGQRQ
jgi:hypothetical protein